MHKFLLLSCFILLFVRGQSQDQERLVTGIVTAAEDGSVLPGVNVIIKGTTTGTATDSDGKFALRINSNNVVLQFSFIGLVTQEIEVGAQASIMVSMTQDSKQLGEVVVVGYGTQERADVTGSITKIKGSEFQNLPVTSYEQGLQGRTPGVQISSSGGELGAAMKIRIRGSSSLTANNQPLIVIDGFIVTTQDQSNFTDNNASNPLADLNPNDIESIDILKDASASAIYGSRASNGVMIITTKHGGKGKTKFNLNYSTGSSQPTHLRKFLNANQYVEMFTEAAKNSGYTTDPAGLDAAWGDYGGGPYSGSGSFTDLVARKTNDNWNKAAYHHGKISQYDFSANGGDEKTKFYVSLAYLDQQGIIIRNAFNRISARVNIDHQVTSKVKFGLSVNQVYSKKNNVPENNQFNSPLQANAISPIISIIDRTGDYNDSTYYANPFRAIANYKDISTQWRNFSNAYINWDITKNLTFRTEGGIDFLGLYEYGWQGAKFPLSAGTPSSGKYGTTRVINYTNNNTLTYTNNFKEKHDVQVLLGQSTQNSTTEFSFIQAQGLPADDFKYLFNASQNTSFSSGKTQYFYVSYFGRVNYKLLGRYLVSASLRNDGSSRFGSQKRYGWFPSASVGWVLSDESFFKNSLGSTVDFLKIKASIGVTGNSEISDYAWHGLYNSTFFGNRGGIYQRQLSNDKLSWEKTTQTDVGIEYGLVNGRISGGVDYYVKNTNDLLLALPTPYTSGYSTSLRNLGKMTNKGWDIYINTKNLTGALRWNTSFNISFYTNKITDLSGQTIFPSNRTLNAAVEGQPIGIFYGVKYAGVDPQNGNALFYLADGTTTASWSKANQPANYRVLGNPNPKHYGGITNNFSYKNFDLSIFGQWSYGNKVYLSSGVFQSSGFTGFGLDNQTVDQLNYWRSDGQKTNVPRPELDVNNGNRTSSRYVSDGSYFRVKTITLSYSIPKSISEKLHLSNVRIYVTTQNPFTITKYKGNDPEIGYNAPTQTTQTVNLNSGVDYYSPPQPKSIIGGIKLDF